MVLKHTYILYILFHIIWIVGVRISTFRPINVGKCMLFQSHGVFGKAHHSCCGASWNPTIPGSHWSRYHMFEGTRDSFGLCFCSSEPWLRFFCPAIVVWQLDPVGVVPNIDSLPSVQPIVI